MSTPIYNPFTVAQQKAHIEVDLTSTFMMQFLFGIYTGIFPAAIYIYVHRENRGLSKSIVVIGSLTALYVTIAYPVLLNWYYSVLQFTKDSGTRVELFIEGVTHTQIPVKLDVLLDIALFAEFAFADALLVWRCFHACGQSLRKTSVPLVLLFVEIVLVLCSMVYRCLFAFKSGFETLSTIHIFYRINGAMFISVALTSLLSTILICYEIYSRTTRESWSRRRYQHVVNALVESSGVYSVAAIVSAILQIMDTAMLQSFFIGGLVEEYALPLAELLGGIAPTLMIARLFLAPSSEDTEANSSVQLPSGLQTHPRLAGGSDGSEQVDVERQLIGSVGGDRGDGQSDDII
ncbi:hypothetical protein CPC08DRAFT_712941 [Agrocybe pediades]|nr:hypothetical protein CPC08DRAFT_712941 [Agrocybe pediades]